MRIAALKLRNFQCFKGEHSIDNLEALPYSIVARQQSNPDRSNYLGKSSIMESIRFALYGVHRHRLDEGWITRGESGGSVELRLDDGTIIKRTKVIGKAGRLYVQEPGVTVDKAAIQDEAQAIILRRIGVGDDDFVATSYFEQKRMSRLVTAKPEERMHIVNAWLDLEPLVRAEEFAREHASAIGAEVDAIDRAIDVQKGMVSEYTEKILECEGFIPPIEQAYVDVEILVEKVRTAREKYEEAHALLRKFDNAERFAQIREQGIELQRDIDAIPSPDEEELERMRSAHAVLLESRATIRHTIEGKRLVAIGKFDGRCPVVPMDCPARSEINNRSTVAAAEIEKLSAREQEATAAAHRTFTFLERQRVNDNERVGKQARLERLAEEAQELQADKRATKGLTRPDVASSRVALEEAENALASARGAVERLEGRAAAASKAKAEIARLNSERAKLSETLATAREALVILGKNGAQRKVAESALAAIEEGANDLLATAGVDLTVSVLWSREGRGLADHCSECGNPFPSSTKVKACVRCQAARGPKLVNKLEIELSERSGAAEDLAGIALQLSASAWLRSARGIAWSVALIDEPFSACDKANRRALSTHLATMLAAYGYSQAFVVAHDAQSVDALPARVEILSDGKVVLDVAAR